MVKRSRNLRKSNRLRKSQRGGMQAKPGEEKGWDSAEERQEAIAAARQGLIEAEKTDDEDIINAAKLKLANAEASKVQGEEDVPDPGQGNVKGAGEEEMQDTRGTNAGTDEGFNSLGNDDIDNAVAAAGRGLDKGKMKKNCKSISEGDKAPKNGFFCKPESIVDAGTGALEADERGGGGAMATGGPNNPSMLAAEQEEGKGPADDDAQGRAPSGVAQGVARGGGKRRRTRKRRGRKVKRKTRHARAVKKSRKRNNKRKAKAAKKSRRRR